MVSTVKTDLKAKELFKPVFADIGFSQQPNNRHAGYNYRRNNHQYNRSFLFPFTAVGTRTVVKQITTPEKHTKSEKEKEFKQFQSCSISAKKNN